MPETRTYYYALQDCWFGTQFVVTTDREPAPFGRWLRISRDDYFSLRRAGGFRIRTNKQRKKNP